MKVKDKGEKNKVYEYFRVEETVFTGKHREYIDALWTQNKILESYVERLIDLYMIAAAVGLKSKRKAEEDKVDELKRTVQTKQLNDNLDTLNQLMRMAIILDDSSGKTVEERIEEAFRIPSNYEDYKRNMNLFNAYARGGIEVLYENLIASPVKDTDIDYGDGKITKIISFITNDLELEEIL